MEYKLNWNTRIQNCRICDTIDEIIWFTFQRLIINKKDFKKCGELE